MTNPWTVATSATAVALSSTRFFFTRSAILRRQVSPRYGVATMSATGEKNLSSDAAHLETIFKQKKALRSVVKRDLKSMDSTLRSQEDEAIQRIVMEAPWFKACKRLCAYISCSALREVDTTQILSHVLGSHPEMQKKLFVPRVEDRNRNMRMLHISSADDLIASSMDILEPAPVDADGNEREDVLFANEPVDLFLLPGLAFDKAGRRLGRGGGYYDTFLSRYQELAMEQNWKQPLKIALCYSVQIVDEGTIPLTPNDILVDALVSPSGVIPISPAALEIRH
ncbi:PREDICTED: 5-formyltetrahydrofolate cyclo-ligase, mitochondrial-like isoform X2 [Nicotiana attenuata]|uniref:5-formyltetrahydrofolate cyclo-ligase, mitochondrial-like isoform X2 n=1 Tax=Nicotiana attenuata TaxID=49451 RepID=UPI000904C9A3|nr:PREDICTED: 5-formyltetrahydrofolate cyclo-ligase, mitochondrial-like isoform X2 [Nicotiana attenuata]